MKTVRVREEAQWQTELLENKMDEFGRKLVKSLSSKLKNIEEEKEKEEEEDKKENKE